MVTSDLPVRPSQSTQTQSRRQWLSLLGFGTLAGAAAAVTAHWPSRMPRSRWLPADFDPIDCLILGWFPEFTPQAQRAVAQAIAAATRATDVLVIVPGSSDSVVIQSLLPEYADRERIRFLEFPIESPWTRDYGPMVVKRSDGSREIVDFAYAPSLVDDQVPTHFSKYYGLPLRQESLCLEGGNLLSNGCGLLLTTKRLIRNNVASGFNARTIRECFADALGATEVVFLDELAGESSGHVDMFASFLAPDLVLLGQYDPAVDSRNAAVLDRNAERLQRIQTAVGPLRVIRIPMPRRQQFWWYTHANLIHANGVLLVPIFSNRPQEVQQQALQTIARHAKGQEICPIDCSHLMVGNGSLHCLSNKWVT